MASGIFTDKYVHRPAFQCGSPLEPRGEDAPGTRIKLVTNQFRLTMHPQAQIFCYSISLSEGTNTPGLKEEIWEGLAKRFPQFVLKLPSKVFAPAAPKEAVFCLPSGRTVRLTPAATYNAAQVNSCRINEAQVVLQHLVKRLGRSLGFQRVGRRYFDQASEADGLVTFRSFAANLHQGPFCGAQLQLDVVHRPQRGLSVLEQVRDALDVEGCDNGALREAEWRRRVDRAVVVTVYNNRVYRIKAVRFDMNINSTFMYRNREDKTTRTMTFTEFYGAYYERSLEDIDQPLLEAYAEKSDEKVFLIPQLVSFTGFSDDMRKDKNLMQDWVKQAKISPQERYKSIKDLAKDIADKVSDSSEIQRLMEAWRVQLESPEPYETEARVLEPCQVSFGQKRFQIEEGNFQRWMRNGLQCPAFLDDWIIIFPESDMPVLDIWLRSLRDIAQMAFAMRLKDPTRISCTAQKEELSSILQQHVTPETQLVLLLTPQKGSKIVYQIFKRATATHTPVITQVVRSETIRKRQSIAAVLSHIVLQINAKCCGPLWHVDLATTPEVHPFFSEPTMVIGLDLVTGKFNNACLGVAASLDTQATEYYSTAVPILGSNRRDMLQALSTKLQEAFKNALRLFTQRNEGLLPDHILVYRASAREGEWSALEAVDISSLEAVMSFIQLEDNTQYKPTLTYIAVAESVGLRLFNGAAGEHNMRNVDPGTVIDGPIAFRSDVPCFFLVNQSTGKGLSQPSHYAVLKNTGEVEMDVLQLLTHRLSFLYFNHTGSVRLPAPAQYAKKIAHHVSSVVNAQPHERLASTLFFL